MGHERSEGELMRELIDYHVPERRRETCPTLDMVLTRSSLIMSERHHASTATMRSRVPGPHEHLLVQQDLPEARYFILNAFDQRREFAEMTEGSR